ncbi:MAG: SDR family NAD(P)-dependent oxidoreductase [Candidatus Zixiibacteriota bacterium]
MPENHPSILITGANGFVGARLCRLFIDKGFEVIAGVRKTSDLSQLKDLNVTYRYGDVNSPETLEQMVAGVDYIIHNAGVVKVKRQETFFEVNEKGTLNLFEAISRFNPGVKKVVYISSLAAAGPTDGDKPVTEQDEPHPITVYGRSKLAGERAALSYSDRINVMAVRPPGIYGPGDKEILAFFQTVNNRIKPYIGDTSRKLQLVHVDDLCHGLYLAITSETKTGAVYFVAENRSYAMKELIGLLQAAIGKKCFPLVIPSWLFKTIAFFSEGVLKLFGATPMLTIEKAGELLASWEVSTRRAKEDFGYDSQIPFERGARETYQWYINEGWLK